MSTTADKMKGILDLLQTGNEDLKVANSRDVILVLGEAQADKSKLTRFIAGEDHNLVSRGLRFGEDWVFQVEEGFTRSVESSAIIPKLVVDNVANGTVFYDCPEFDDGKNEAEDIASAYFIQKVLSRAESAKLILVVKYDSVKPGSSHDALEKFLSKASSFIINKDIFKDSVGFIVTQVDAYASEDLIRDNLSSVHRNLLNKKKTAEADLLGILLAPGKIGIWKRPQTPGLVKNIESLQNDRESLRKLIYEKIHYYVFEKQDFSIVLSNNSKRYLPGLSEEITKDIAADVAQIGQQFADYYREKENSSRDVDGLFLMFYNLYLSKWKLEDWSSVKDPKGFVKRSLEIMKEMDINVSKEYLLSVLNSDLYLAFIETALGKPTRRQIDWADGFNTFTRYLEQSYRWYQNLANLQNVDLSSYTTQQNIESYRKAAEHLKATISKGGDFSKSFKQFLQAFNQHEEIIDYVLALDVDARKKELLREVVDITFENHLTKPEKPCIEKKLSISGQFVKISDINNCVSDKNCCENPKEVEIFATHKVFFDEDIDWTGKEVQLSIIAPTWEVIGDRKIVLDGKAGEAPKVAKESAQNNRPGSPGNPGAPGLPGGSAGGLLAIGEKCVSCNLLKISLIGGKGGPGQDGGDGLKGKDGDRPYNPYDDGSYSSMKDLWEKHGNRPRCKDELVGGAGSWKQDCNAFGLDGTVGGIGGDGGKGGEGGASGKVSMVFTQNHGSPIVETGDGLRGDNGRGGKGGEGGKDGDDFVFHIIYFIGYLKLSSDFYYIPQNSKAVNGAPGGDGQNAVPVKSRQSLQFINPSFPVNKYKAFMRKNLNRSLQLSNKFLESLGSDDRVIKLYDTMGLVKDMQCLEEQFQDLQKLVPLSPYYTNLQERIAKYTGVIGSRNENDDHHKLVLSYLYSAVLSKLHNMDNRWREGLVVNITDHIEKFKNEIDHLRKAKQAVDKNKSKEDYQKIFKSKVEEANHFIADVIEPEIKNTIKKTDEQINSLIDETLALEKAAEKERDQLIVKQHTLQDQLVLRYLLGTVEVASQLLVLAGPVGATVGAVIGGANQVAQGLLLTDDDGNQDLKAVPEGVKKSFAAISDHFKEKKESFKKQLADANESLNKLDEKTLNDISIKAVKEKIQETQKKLKIEMEKQNEFDPESIDRMYNMRKELSDSLDKEKSLLEKAGGEADKKVDYVGKLKQLIDVGKAGKDVYDKIKKSEKAIDKLGESIKKANANIAKLELQEQNIYKTIMPMVKGISGTLQNLREDGSSKSHVALDVNKWQIQSNMRDISKKLKEMTEGYKAQGELTYLMDKVEHGMSAMIQVYDRIQEYQEKAELADYLAQISLASTKVGNIDGPLKSAADYLEMNVHFNIVLAAYEKAVDALKHSVFPFAKRYLRTPDNVMSKFKFDTGKSHIDNVVNRMSDDFDGFSKELGKDTDILLQIDRHNNPFQYYMSALDSYPFYSWKFAGHEDIIGKLFNGEEIVLAADVTDEQVDKLEQDAIKFKQIGIDLVLTNDQSANARMKDVLKGFKVNMTHLGHSHYECGSKTYAIFHDPEEIQHSVNKFNVEQRKPEYENGNVQYYTLSSNKPLLSPYTTWRINLFVDKSKKGDYNFGKLAEFKGKPIELELEGTGQFIQRHSEIHTQFCNNELDQYYQQVKTSAKEDNVDLHQDVNILEMLAEGKGDDVKRTRRAADGAADRSSTDSILSSIANFGHAAVKYLNPGQWLTSQQPNGSDIISVLPVLDVPTPPSKVISYNRADSVEHKVDNGLLNLQSNLLLMGLLGPKSSNTRIKRRAQDRAAFNNFAHNIAYRAYAPRE